MDFNLTLDKIATMVEWSDISQIPEKDCRVFLLDSEHSHITDGFYSKDSKKFSAKDSSVQFTHWMEAPNNFNDFISFSKDSHESIVFQDTDGTPVAVLSGFNLKVSYNFQKLKTTDDIEKVADGFAQMMYENMVHTLNKAVK